MTKVKLKDATRELLADATKVKEEASRARKGAENLLQSCLLYTSPSPRDRG